MKCSKLYALLLSVANANERCGTVDFGEYGQFPPRSLSSYPGSGNTWVRYLIEEFTGYYTGSIYDDKKLYQGGFKGETENWKEGRVIAVKSHSYREDRGLGDAILLIRNPFDAILAEFNRQRGLKSGDHHTGVATNDDFQSPDWTDMDMDKRAWRWYKLYAGNLLSGRNTLPILYEHMKQNPVPEMQKISNFLNQTNIDYDEKIDCLFGESSKKFKRSSDRGYDPYNFIESSKLKIVNERIRQLSDLLNKIHKLELPEDYYRDL